jgi:hypothetical protein
VIAASIIAGAPSRGMTSRLLASSALSPMKSRRGPVRVYGNPGKFLSVALPGEAF